MTALDLTIIGFFAFWFLCVAATHMPRRLQLPPTRWNPFVRFDLAPGWTFFSEPDRPDYHVFYRDLTATLEASEWREVPLVRQRTARCAVWHPERRDRQALRNICLALKVAAQRALDEPASVILSLAYLQLLSVVADLPREASTRFRQFLVIESSGFVCHRPARLVLRSECHRV